MWLPRRRRELRPSTARRYQWYVENYIALRSVRPARQLAALRTSRPHVQRTPRHGGAQRRIVVSQDGVRRSRRDAFVVAVRRRPAPRRSQRRRRRPTTADLDEVTAQPGDLDRTATRARSSVTPAHLRLYPTIHLAATTGMRRGEIAGLRWADWHTDRRTDSPSRVADRASRAAPSKSRPRPQRADDRIDLDANTEQVLARWRRRQQRDGQPVGVHDPMFTNGHGEPVNPESISQLFDRKTLSSGLPRIRLHDLRHTHASLLVAAGEPIKVVSERLGHAHPGFTMATYQHLLPGMGAAAATNFAALLATAGVQHEAAGPIGRRVTVGRRSTGSASRTPGQQLGVARSGRRPR